MHEVAFKSQLGEFSVYSFQPSDIATREELFLEIMELAAESKDVRRVILVPDEDGYGMQVDVQLGRMKGKESITLLGMNPPAHEIQYKFELLGFAVLQSLGVRADEL